MDDDHAAALERFDEELARRLRAEGKCGRPRRGEGKGKLCRQPAGKATEHPGEGACWLHGGRKKDGTDRRLKSGVYSSIQNLRVKEIVDQLKADQGRQLDATEELVFARALLIDWTENYELLREAVIAWNATRAPEDRPATVPDIQQAGPILERISRMIYRIERASSDKYIPRGQFYRVMQAMGRAVDARVVDEAVKEQIKDDWLRIEVP
jgi:hypothetical protein